MEYTSEELADITHLALHRMAYSAPDSEVSQDMRNRALAALKLAGRQATVRPQRPVLSIAGLAAATTKDEMYGALAALGHAFMRANEGSTTEIRKDDGTVIALITPPGGPS